MYSHNGWLDVSPVCVEDIRVYDAYPDMPKYGRPVLIPRGDRDAIVPMSCSERAAKTYPDARLRVVKGGAHGFRGDAFARAIPRIDAYFRKIGLPPVPRG